MYWYLLAINPTVAGEIVLSENPAIVTDADRLSFFKLPSVITLAIRCGLLLFFCSLICNASMGPVLGNHLFDLVFDA